jgi:glycosyltransferase involved in cell wall biosynthesis
VRILLVSQMYPGPDDPDLGTFVQQVEHALRARGHSIELAVLDRRAGGKARYSGLARRAVRAARSFRPDVVYAHFLVPAGLIGALASRGAPLVVTAHGQDVANIGAVRGIGEATRYVVGRAAAVIAVSDYLRRELESKIPAARGKTDVIDCGVDLERFRFLPARPANGGPAFVCIGGLTDRKNVVRLADAFERVGEGTLTFAGDGPLRPQLAGRSGVALLGTVPPERIPELIGAGDVVCQPSLVEPFGQALLEAMACGRPVVATSVGGPPEFVRDGAGVLVDPTDVGAISDAMREAAELPCPNPAARAAAEEHDVVRQAARIEAVLERAARATHSWRTSLS